MPISAFTCNHTTLHDPHGVMNPGKLKNWQPQKLRAVAL